MCSFIRGNIEGTNASKTVIFAYFLLFDCAGMVLRFDLRKPERVLLLDF